MKMTRRELIELIVVTAVLWLIILVLALTLG
jgi:hypothetical protein